ncbi:protein hairy-like [Dreissena polymorpha]|uniref:protein hairy-like n=1 Tax=Dreissena polymorpha TaxID=45954 RepID=UPI0022640F63|nr:protein hairy-like [Dreissena polymorpha]XP_052212936.1 protein hairy-like [Dreissena polymorpha]
MADTAVESGIMTPHNTNMDKKDSAYKRSNKPFMEKKRRARINNCLTQLKTLVLQAMRKDTNQYSKLEKADILEMTVKHLRQLQRQQVSQAITCDPNTVTKYKSGFNECANEVVRYLSSVPGVDSDVRSKLINHLGNVVTQVNGASPEVSQQPLNVQIPAAVGHNGQAMQNGCLLMTTAGVHPSTVVLQQKSSPTNVAGLYSQGHIIHNIHQQQQQQQQQRLYASQPQFCGSFQIVQSPGSSSPVAVYLGQTQTFQQQYQPHHHQQQQQYQHTTQPSPTDSLSRSPPRTKASLKAFDSSFSQMSDSEHSNASSPSCSPASSPTSYPTSVLTSHLEYTVKCGRTPSPLKVDDVWRPW